jgi:antitoxin component YwqK of YwqJK toxin-antitoxin module
MVDGAPFTGEIVEFAPTGELVELITVVDGLPHGPSLSWYCNGQLRLEQSLAWTRPVGRSRSWHPNGALADELMFDDGGNLLSKVVWGEHGDQLERTTYDHPQDGRRAW